MPIYEFKCVSCQTIKTVLVNGYDIPGDIVCDHCGSKDVVKIISRVNYHQSHAERISQYDPNATKSDSFYKDNRNIGLHAEHMLRKSGIKPTQEFTSKVEKLRTNPASVIKGNDD